MRSRATWLVVAAVGAVVLAGVVDSVRGSSSHLEANVRVDSVTEPSSTTASTEATSTRPVSATPSVVTTERSTNVVATVSAAAARLPSCHTDQLRLAFALSDDLWAVVLRRMKPPACHHGRAPVGFTARDQSGDRVAVFGRGTQTTQPANFSNGFAQLLEIPQMSCDPDGSILVVATVGPYVARQTAAGSELPCNHG